MELSAVGRLTGNRREPSGDLGPPGHAELGPDVFDVRGHGPRRDHQLPGDLPVGVSDRDQPSSASIGLMKTVINPSPPNPMATTRVAATMTSVPR